MADDISALVAELRACTSQGGGLALSADEVGTLLDALEQAQRDAAEAQEKAASLIGSEYRNPGVVLAALDYARTLERERDGGGDAR